MQNDLRKKIIEILINELDYCYCDNCKYNDYEIYGDRFCECYRKYQNWALSPVTAEKIVDKIIQLGEIYPVSKEELKRGLNNAE